ncbi:MAG TPA: SCP2 sterol-binding domain-containing protein [Holophagaceae bacterium]|jgi:putative sterol carrier protein|nr:SCP2 sterol-binding domain-containing protein [Holophagaceae bacterium]
MATTVDEIFQRMSATFLPEKAAGLSAVIAYHITGEGGGDYSSVIKDGAYSLETALRADAQATLTMAAPDWIALNEGTLDPMTAFVSGKLKIAGDQGLAQKFPRYFKRPSGNGSGIPLADLVPQRLALLAQPFRLVMKDAAWGSGPELRGEDSALRGLVEGQIEPGPALLGGQLVFAGDMALLRGAWASWSAAPVSRPKPKRPSVFALALAWIKSKF